MDEMLFGSWSSLLRTLVVGVLAYAVLIVFLRLAGNRTLSKLNAFDLVVTVALGSTLATVLLNADVSLADGALAFALLIGLQFVVTWSSVRASGIRQFVTGEPVMLLYRGEFLHGAMRQARVAEDEVHAAIRSTGLATPNAVEAVVLETDGSLSVVRRNDGQNRESLAGMKAPIADD